MSKNLLKVLSMILTVATIVGCFAISVNATTQTGKIDALSYKIVKGEVTITDCDNDENVVIPAEIEDCTVSAIGNFAFDKCTNLKKVTIPSSVKTIGYYSFSGCTSLATIIFNEGLTSIGISAFEKCTSLKSITFPASLKSIGNWAFEGCKSLEIVTFDEALENIGEWAFKDCLKITSIEIPQNVNNIGDRAFAGCNSIQSYSVVGANNYYSSDFSGILYNKAQTNLIYYPSGRLSNYCSLPSTLTSISNYAFYKCNTIESVVLKDNVKSIGANAFAMCEKLSSIKFSKALETIGQNAFYGCTKLGNVDFPTSLKAIGKYAFYGCESVTTLNLKESLQTIGEYAFLGCNSIKAITVDAANTSFASDESGVLYNKDFTKLILYPVANTRTEYTVQSTAVELGSKAFYNANNLSSIIIPRSLVTVPDYSIGYIFDEVTETTILKSDLTITCYKNSAFHTYGSEKGFKLKLLNDAVITKLELDNFTLKSGNKLNIAATIETSGDIGYNVAYFSSDVNVATVSGNEVKGVKYGTCTFTVVVTDENGNKYTDTAICSVQRGSLEMFTYIVAFGWLTDLFKK